MPTAVPRLLTPALVAAVVSAAALTAAGVHGVVQEAPDAGGPAFTSWPLLTVLAVLPAAVAALLVYRGRSATAAGVLIGVAALAPGRALADVQFAVDSSRATRPEFLVPGSVGADPSWIGLLLLLTGHIAAVVAGVLAVRASTALPDDGQAPEAGSRAVGMASVVVALALAVGLLMPPYVSADANLLDNSALDGPLLVVLGVLACGLGAVVAVVIALSERSWGRFTGVLAGVAVAGVAIALPNLAAAVVRPWLSATAGPIVVLVAAVALLGVPVVGTVASRRESSAAGPSSRNLYVAAGALALLAAIGAVVGSGQPLVRTATGGAAALSDAQVWLIPAGVVYGLLGVGMFVPRVAPLVRPAVAVAWVGVVLASGPALQLAVSAPDVLVDSTTGAGALWIASAVAAAALAAGCAVTAGVMERDGTAEVTSPAVLRWLALTTAVVAAGTFVFSAVGTTDQYRGVALVHPLDVAFGGALVSAVVVVGALALVPWSRPARAAGTLVGVLCVLLVRMLEPFLVSAAVGTGAWLAVGCAVLTLVLLSLTFRHGRAKSDR